MLDFWWVLVYFLDVYGLCGALDLFMFPYKMKARKQKKACGHVVFQYFTTDPSSV